MKLNLKHIRYKSKVRIESKYTQYFNTEKGVRQGNIMPPFLFNVIKDEIISDVLENRNTYLKIVAVADEEEGFARQLNSVQT